MTSAAVPMRIKCNPATHELHHVPLGAPGYDGWDDLGPVPEDWNPYTRRFDHAAGRYVEDHGWAERRLRSVRAEYKRLARADELAVLANIPVEVAEAIEAKRRAERGPSR